MKTPTLIGTLIFMISLMIAIIIALPPYPETPYLELFLIWFGGIIGGIGLGYGNRESFGFDEGNTATVVGGLGLGWSILISFLLYYYNLQPIDRVVLSFISSLIAIFGLYMVIVSTQESY
ncbi:MAG: hypothetical protein ACFFAE_01560 [Candidatus Hodarchaeota archaeon]